MSSPADALEQVLAALDRLEIRYLVGGSVASAVHGIPRPTMDVDLLVDLDRRLIPDLVAALGAEFYADEGLIRDAFDRGRAFNLIHIPSAYKFDLFPKSRDPFDAKQLDRRRFASTDLFGRAVEFAVASPEDIVLSKLRWYRLGGCSSERQWEDMLGVVENQTGLDLDYLRHWAAHLGVTDLLDRLLQPTIRPSRM